MDFCLVMTASVNPNGMSGLSPESVRNREDQYIRTLQFYRSAKCVDRILFVENSNWNLDRLKASVQCDPKIVFLSLNMNVYPREWGKGYGEMMLMDEAFKLASSIGVQTMVKVTGRFPILNIETMIKEFSARRNLSLAIDIIDHKCFDVLGLKWRGHAARTVCYAVSLDFYRDNVLGEYRRIPMKYWNAEELMMAVWQRTKNLEGIYPRFRHELKMSGYSGGSRHTLFDTNNYDGFLYNAKRCIRQIMRMFLPWIWL